MSLTVNQVEISLLKLDCLVDGTLDQCVAEKITPMAWSPLGGGRLAPSKSETEPPILDSGTIELIETLDTVARQYNTTRTNLALAWLLKHPAGIVPIVGSVTPQSIREAANSVEINISREDWYRLFEAARGERLP